MSEQPLYVRFRGRTSGPFSVADLHRMVDRGQLSRMHQVSTDQTSWCRAHEAPSLKSAFERPRSASGDTAVSLEPVSSAKAEPDTAAKRPRVTPVAPEVAEPPIVQDDDRWYYTHRRKTVGPVSLTVIQELMRDQAIRPDSLVWRPGMHDWKPLAEAGVTPAPINRDEATGPPESEPASLRYAGFWLRFCATVMDQLILSCMGFVAGIVIGSAAPGLAVALNSQWEAQTALFLAGVVLTWFYSAALESSPLRGTLGKLALCLYVADPRQGRLSFARASGRHFAKYLSGLTIGVGFVMIAFDKRKQGLHDMVADTLVLRQ